MGFKEWLEISVIIIALLGTVLKVFGFIRNPDIKADTRLKLMEQACGMKHGTLDKVVADFNIELRLIKENHLAHIEKSLTDHDLKFEKLFTILDERLPVRRNEAQ